MLLSAAVIGTSIAGLARADFSAKAEQVQAVQDTLIAPTSYEQYLPLSSPNDVAVTDNYTAIAQGNTIYIYDRSTNTYTAIDFSSATSEPITKTQFSGDYLYCLDAGMLLYRLNLQAHTIEFVNLACTNFLIHGETLFYTTSSGNMSKLYQASLQTPNSGATLLAEKIAGLPSLAFWNGELYYTIDTQITLLFKINPQTKDFIQVNNFPQQTLHDLSIAGGMVAFTVAETENGGDFYTYSIADFSAPLTKQEGVFSSVTAYGDCFYTIEENSVKQYDLQTQTFTQFEICGASNSRHRLDGAKATYLSGDTLYIADNGNNRISIYNTVTAQFETPIATTLQPLYISAYENTLLIANQTTVEVYDTAAKTLTQTWDGFTGKIVGVASVYGTQYVATDANFYYAITQSSVTEITKTSTLQTPDLFTSDAYGNLYLLSGKKVYSFTESTLKESETTAELVCEFTTDDIQQISVDYNQTVYALSGNKIITATQEYAFDTPLVYATQTPNVTAFAFDVLENTTYALMDETYVLSTARLQLPTVKTVAVENAGEQIFANASAEFSVLQTKANALLGEFDITALKGATYFPYIAHNRAMQSLTALKIGETSTHYVIAHFNENKNAYQTYFVRKGDCTFMAGDVFRTDYAENERSVLYVSSDVALYKFPYLTNLLTVTQLQRGAKVTVLGEIRQLDNEYYQVQYTNDNGETLVGYIPKAFTNTFSGLPMPEHAYQAGAETSDTDAVWRLAYILLGFGAICILVDYLLLRKRKPIEYETDGQIDEQM